MNRIEMAIIALIIYIHIVSWLTPTAITACYHARGYYAVGGEWVFLLTVPFALLKIGRLYMGAIRRDNNEIQNM